MKNNIKTFTLFVRNDEKSKKIAEYIRQLAGSSNIPLEEAQNGDLVIAIGGDGTFLNAVNSTGFGKNKVYAGIHTGTLGFLQNLSENDIYAFIQYLSYEKDGITIYLQDNLELLTRMEDESVNLIYCDILYNTGKKFDDYNDNLGAPEEAVEWYRPRFIEMKRVLARNGSIFIHCNWRMDSYIRILMDQIFGGSNFRNRIYRKHSKERGFHKNFDSQMDTILYYVKDHSNFIFNELYSKKVRVAPLFENGYIEGRSEARRCNGELIDLGKINKHWLISSKDLEMMQSKGEVTIINSMPYRFSKVVPVGNLWAEDEMLDRYERTSIATAYDTPKPEAILERIITTCSNPGDTVADFFLGGGTTAVVAKRLGRKGIFCDINPKACNVTIKKLNEEI